jgi:putative ABC transport system permease protein
MVSNNLEIGDSIKLKDIKYKITGDFERPDYIFMIKDTSDTFSFKAGFGIAEVTDEKYDELFENAKVTGAYYSIIYNRDNEEEVRKEINENYHMISYLKASANSRIQTPLTEIEQTKNIMNVIIVLFVIFITIIISVVIGRRIKNDRRQIGVLVALGYKKSELSRHYAFYGFIPGFFGGIIGYVISVLSVDKLVRLMMAKIEPIPVEVSFKVTDILLVLLVPTFLYTVSVYRSAKKVMKMDVVSMISGRSTGKSGRKMRMKKSHLSVKNRYKLRQIFGKPGRSVIVLIGVAFGGMLYAFCAVCIDSMDYYVKNTVDQIGSFEYEYFLKEIRMGDPEEGSAVLGGSYEVKGREDPIMLLGIDDPDYICFKDENCKEIKYDEDKFYITSMASLGFDAGAGDEITFVNPITLDEYTVKIDAVLKNDAQSAIYCSRENAAKLIDIPEDCYNIIMSDKELDIEEDDLAKTISKASLADQINEVKKGMENILAPINTFAIAICIIVIFMMVSVLLSESSASISMLKVLGYHDREINKMIINVYHILIPIAIVVSLMLGFYGTKTIFRVNVTVFRTYLETLVYPMSVVKVSLLVLASYVLSLLLLRGKVGKVDLVESLKDNRE